MFEDAYKDPLNPYPQATHVLSAFIPSSCERPGASSSGRWRSLLDCSPGGFWRQAEILLGMEIWTMPAPNKCWQEPFLLTAPVCLTWTFRLDALGYLGRSWGREMYFVVVEENVIDKSNLFLLRNSLRWAIYARWRHPMRKKSVNALLALLIMRIGNTSLGGF